MTIRASIAGLAIAFLAGALQGWRWGLDTGRREVAAQANRQTALGGESRARAIDTGKDKLVTLSIDVHSMSRQLHPSILDDLGLPDAIASECERFRRKDSIGVDFRAENITQEIPPDVAVCLYRIAQEGLRNISRHGGATEVTISLVGKNDIILLTIMDNGRGFDPDRVKGKQDLGLDSMKERAYLIGGDFSLESQPGQGTVIEVLVPLSRSPL